MLITVVVLLYNVVMVDASESSSPTESPTAIWTYASGCPPSRSKCSDSSLAQQGGSDSMVVCEYYASLQGFNRPCIMASADPNRKGCWLEKATGKCFIYPGAPTCDTSVTGQDWEGYVQKLSCTIGETLTPTISPTSAPVAKESGKEKSKIGKGKEKGKEKAKTSKAPVVAPATRDEKCKEVKLSFTDINCSNDVLVQLTNPVVCQAAHDSPTPCIVGKDPNGVGCWGDRFGKCLIYSKTPKCTDSIVETAEVKAFFKYTLQKDRHTRGYGCYIVTHE